MDLVLIAPLGLLVGLVLGALGGGGAILLVPILVYVVGQSSHAATASSLVIVALSSLVALVPHLRAGHVRVRDAAVFGVLGAAGSFVGSRANPLVPEPILMTSFAALLLFVAFLTTRPRRRGGAADAAGGDSPRRGPWTLVAAATVTGLLTGFFGVGGGFAVVPALVLALGLRMQVAVGTSLLVIVFNSLTALGSRVGAGLDLDWPVVLAFALTTSLGALWGARMSRRWDPVRLKKGFGVLLVVVAVFLAVENVPRMPGL